MSATKSLAFVLKTQDYRDTSLLATFYTRDFGKVRGIVKGVRDQRARYGSTMEPFSLNEILFYRRRRGADLHQVTQVDLAELFTPVREDLERVAYACYMTELLNELTDVEEAHPEVFDLFRAALDFLASGASPRRVTRIFEVKLFDLLGLMPEIRECVVCRTEWPDPAYFSPSLGGVHCKGCGDKLAEPASPAGRRGFAVRRGTLAFIDHARRATVKDLYNVKVTHEVGSELERLLRRFADYQLASKLKSVVFLEKLGFNE